MSKYASNICIKYWAILLQLCVWYWGIRSLCIRYWVIIDRSVFDTERFLIQSYQLNKVHIVQWRTVRGASCDAVLYKIRYSRVLQICIYLHSESFDIRKNFSHFYFCILALTFQNLLLFWGPPILLRRVGALGNLRDGRRGGSPINRRAFYIGGAARYKILFSLKGSSTQSCKMSRIKRIYPCKYIGQLG